MTEDNRENPAPEENALKRMAPIISHEIRNPLAIIGNSAYYIKTKLSTAGEVDPKIQRHLSIIEAEIRHANGTLEEVLSYARMRDAVPAPHDLNALAEEALRAVPAPVGVTPRKELAAGKLPVRADSELAGKALQHLIRNAFEALAISSGEKTVTVASGAEGKRAWVEVSDTGPGLPAEAVERLFIPFTTTKPRGVGLGLAFARKALRRQGGDVERMGSSGARFRLSLPAA
jgi:signal transduction histidine kinase